MMRRLQVFVSSTFTDMRDEREAAVEAILQAGHIPAGMELFAAGSESQWDTIKRWIDDSDVFLLILGGRYGTIEPKSGKSYIELEYFHAVNSNKAFFAVVMHDSLLNKKVKKSGAQVLESDNNSMFRDFRAAVKSRTCTFFEDVKDLKYSILQSITQYAKNESLVGWIRRSDIVDPKPIQDRLERLQLQNSKLQSRVAELSESNRTTSLSTTSGVPALSAEAQLLLLEAAEGDGRIFTVTTSNGFTIMSGGKSNRTLQSPRDEAKWKGVLKDLLRNDLIEETGSRGEAFQLTEFAYTVADALKLKA